MFRKVLLLCAFAVLATVLAAGGAMAEGRKIRVATSCTWPPMEFLDAGGRPAGFTVDLLIELGKMLKVEFDIRDVPWDGIFSGLGAGRYDMVAASTTVTPERQKLYLFSSPYYGVVQSVVMPAGRKIKDLADLKGLKVGGQIGTTGISVMEKAKTGATVREYDDLSAAMKHLGAGRIDAVICDSSVASYYANVKKEYRGRLHVPYRTSDVEQLGFCFPKGGVKLQKLLNEGLRKLRASGRMAELVKKWMGE